MTNPQINQFINKGLQLNILKPQIQLQLTKTDITNVLNEAMKDEAAGASIKRILNPFLAEAFPQFPEFNAVTLGDTAEDGSTIVTLKKRVERAANTNEEPEDGGEGEVETELAAEDEETPVEEPVEPSVED